MIGALVKYLVKADIGMSPELGLGNVSGEIRKAHYPLQLADPWTVL